MENTDAFGNALIDYLNGGCEENITVISNIAEDDVIPVNYLFRTQEEFPKIEKRALELCKGKILDVGAGSGCHSLMLESTGFNVKAIDISKGAVEVMKKRGIKNVEQIDFFKLKNEKFDTILFLMNGVGIAGTIEDLKRFLKKAKMLLNKGGQILLDSSDIKYMFTEEDGSVWVDLNSNYYGEVVYQMEYRDSKTEPFNWLFIDFDTLKKETEKVGLNTKLALAGKHHDYLAQLTINNNS